MVALTDAQYRNIIQTLLRGFGDSRPNPRVAAILTAEANLGMRVGDILRLHMADFVRDGYLSFRNISCQIWNWMCYIIIWHRKYRKLCYTSLRIIHYSSSFINICKLRIQISWISFSRRNLSL